MTEKIVAVLAAIIIGVISRTGYLGVIILMAIESACIPLPSEIIMPFAGALAVPAVATTHNTSLLSLYLVAIAGAIGCNVGSVIAYEIGCYGGRPLVEKYGRYLWISRHDLDMADRFFLKFGSAAVFIARLLPVVRTFIALPAGVARMPRLRFHLYTFAGSLPWCFVLAWIGMKLGEQWDKDPRLKQWLHRMDAVIILLLLAAVFWFVRSHWKNRMTATA
ncbi:MAG TPA: DedA family protein [Candidatus Angelobacter sp.]|nr:DedA family protein [Candidatus Angelobacter sp.]